MDISIQVFAHAIHDSVTARTASSDGGAAFSSGTTRNSASHICALACWNLAYSSRRSFLSSWRRSVLYFIHVASSAAAAVTTTPVMVKIPVTTALNPAHLRSPELRYRSWRTHPYLVRGSLSFFTPDIILI